MGVRRSSSSSRGRARAVSYSFIVRLDKLNDEWENANL